MSLESSVISTILYFDVLGFPLTREEVFRYLWMGKGFLQNEVESEIEKLVRGGTLATKSSYYFLPQREEAVQKRLRAVIPSEDKLRRARGATKIIGWVPFLKAIYVCNSVAAETANSSSDIDLFIVTKEKRLWFVRFFTNIILKMFGMRTGKMSANKICLSFYIGEQHLNLAPWRVCDDDIYLAYWLMQLHPLYDPKNMLNSIYMANVWASDYVKLEAPAYGIAAYGAGKRTAEWLLQGVAGDLLEKLLYKFQWAKLRPELKKMACAENACDVVLKDGVLKMHEHDARREFHDRWLKNNLTYVA